MNERVNIICSITYRYLFNLSLTISLFFFLTSNISAQPILESNCGMPPFSGNTSLKPPCTFDADQIIDSHRGDIVPVNGAPLTLPVNFVIVQDLNGDNNFKLSDQNHVSYLNDLAQKMNNRMNNFVQETCDCTENPAYIENSKIQYDVSYYEMRSSIWDNNINNPNPSFNLSCPLNPNYYVTRLFNEFRNHPNYIPGITFFLTNTNLGLQKYNGFWYSGVRCDNDLDHPALIHAPDAFASYEYIDDGNADPYQTLDWLSNSHGRTAAHEIFHQFQITVGHKNSCQFNIMNGSSQGVPPDAQDPSSALTGCQIRMAYGTMMAHHMSKYVPCVESFEDEIVVVNDEIWENRTKILSNIRVLDGGNLRISCQIEMQEDAKIYVEKGGILNLAGAEITSCGSPWEGIIVEGNGVDQGPTAGRVTLNNATISNAKTAITTRPRRSWDPTYYGGLVEVRNSTIENCEVGIRFYKYTGDQNSLVHNTTFRNMKWALNIWDNPIIPITESDFMDISRSAINTWDATISVTENCTFTDIDKTGIKMHHTYQPLIPSRIGDFNPHNTFDNCRTAIYSSGSAGAASELILENNLIIGNYLGVVLDGENDFNVLFNEFEGNFFGLHTFGSGGSDNLTHENEFNNSALGMLSQEQNDNYAFLANCFSNPSASDVYLYGGTVANGQGNNQVAASNCFSSSSIVDLKADGTNTFTYFTPVDPTPMEACLLPNYQGSFILDFSQGSSFENCGLSNATGGNGGNNGTVIDGDCFGVLAQYSITYIINLLSGVNVELYQTSENSPQARVTKQELERCKAQLIRYIVKWYHNENQYTPIFNILSDQQEFRYKAKAYSVLMHTREYAQADTYLNSLITSTEGENDYVRIQNLNLQRLQGSEENSISEVEINEIRTIAQKKHTYHAYAHSLLNFLTGEDIEIDRPDISYPDKSEGRSTDTGELNIYPNPFQDQLVIESKGMAYLLGKQIRIVDYLGNTIVTQKLNSHHQTIDLSAYSQGVYVIVIEEDTRILKQEILFKIN